MTATDFKTQLHSLIRLQLIARTRDAGPDAATRRDRLMRAATMLAQASDAIAAAVSEDSSAIAASWRSVSEVPFSRDRGIAGKSAEISW